MVITLNYSQNPIFAYTSIAAHENGNQLVAVGENAIIISEDNGTTWTSIDLQYLLENILLDYVIYGNGIYIAISNRANRIIRSIDGYIWNDVTPDIEIFGSLCSVAYGKNTFVIVGSNVILKSTDNKGLEWTSITPPDINITGLTSVTFGNDLFIAAGTIPNILTKAKEVLILISNNGYTWSKVLPDISGFGLSITFGNGVFVVVGKTQEENYSGLVIKSNDNGSTWTDVSPSSDNNYLQYSNWTSVSYGNNSFIVAGESGRVMQSIDTTMNDWVNISPDNIDSAKYNDWYSVIYNNDSYLAVGGNGKIIKMSNVSSITDGMWSNWFNVSPFGNTGLDVYKLTWSIAHGTTNNFISVCSDGRILKSIDSGDTWIDITPTYPTDTTNILYSITYGNGIYVISGLRSETSNSFAIILTSIDNGNNWVEQPISYNYTNLYSVTYGNNCFLAVGSELNINGDGIDTPLTYLEYIILKSDGNGENWEQITLTNPKIGVLNSVIYGATNNVIAVGNDGIVIKSVNNGNTWTNITLVDIEKYTWNSISYGGNGIFIAVGVNGQLMKTPDNGDSWYLVNSDSNTTLNAVTYNGTEYIAVGICGTIIKGIDDGDTWSQITDDNINNSNSIDWECVVYGDSKYIAVGFHGEITKSIDAGDTWINVSPSNTYESLNIKDTIWYSITYGDNNTYVGIGYSVDGMEIMKSIDNGITWINVTPKNINYLKNTNMNSVIYGGNNTYIAVGYYRIFIAGIKAGYIIKSTDGGDTWEYITSPILDNNQLYSIVYGGNDTYIAVGNIIIKSTDGGVTWVDKTPDIEFESLFSITHGDNNTYIAVSDDGIIIKSTDGGDKWIDVSFTLATWNSIAYGGDNNYIVVGDSSKDGGTIIMSNDGGNTWRNYSSSIIDKWTSVSSNNNEYVVVGESGNIIISNKNYINWNLIQLPNIPGPINLYSTVYGQNRFILGGDFNAILYLDNVNIDYTVPEYAGLVKLTLKRK
jgi:photosystem II stability/assembly factor-like uncharacterized protein